MATRGSQTDAAGEMAAEFAGTMILILFGVGVVAQVVVGGGLDGGLGDHDSITWAWGIGVTMGVYVAGRMSGAHINPAVTLAMAVFRGFAWRKVLPYVAAQFLGAFVAAMLVRWNYDKGLTKVDPTSASIARAASRRCPATATRPRCRDVGGFLDQIIGTAILLFWLPRSWTCATPRQANLRRSSSACWSSASVWRGARSPVMRSTRPVTSARGWPRR